MTHAQPVIAPLPGEMFVGLVPELATFVDPGFARRQHFWTGRSVSHGALAAEQEHAAGHMALRGRALEPGVVSGLEPYLVTRGGAWHLRIGAGRALTAGGERVGLEREVEVSLDELPVHGLDDELAPNEDGVAPNATLPVLMEQGVSFAPVLALVLRPATAELLLVDEDAGHCPPEATDYPFEDRQRIDAAVLSLVPWPSGLGTPPAPGAAWRNRVAHTVFEKERELDQRVPLGLGAIGVPLAILGIEAVIDDEEGRSYAPVFLDRGSVRREGGTPRDKAALPGSGRRALWSARIDQLAEEIDGIRVDEAPTREELPHRLREQLAYLPPAGILPRELLDLEQRRCALFPISMELDVVPAPVGDLETLAHASAGLAPIDLAVSDRVRLVVPVPSRLYEPELLETPVVDPLFQQTIAELERDRSLWLLRREQLWDEMQLAKRHATGEDPGEYDDPDAIDPDAKPASEGIALSDEEVDRFRYELSPAAFDTRVLEILGDIPTELEDDENITASVPLTDDVLETATVGLPAAIEELDSKIAINRDRLRLGFVQAETDVYRIRQHVLGNHAATRFATSPALATIAKGSVAEATKTDLETFATVLADTTTTRAITIENPDELVPTVELADEFRTLTGRSNFNLTKVDDSFFASAAVTAIEQTAKLKDSVQSYLTNPGLSITISPDVLTKLGTTASQEDLDSEADYFAEAVGTIETSLTALREWETQILEYEKLRDRCEEARVALLGIIGEGEDEIDRLQSELAVTRHDLALARALLAEETARVEALAARRKAILAEHFEFLFFYRPRAVEASVGELYERVVLPGLVEDPVPDCLDEASFAPNGLERMLDLWREVPVRWFPSLKGLLDELPRLTELKHVVQVARYRAETRYATPSPSIPFTAHGAFASPMATIYQARSKSVDLMRQSVAQLDLTGISQLGWKDTRREAEQVVSLGDLLDGTREKAAAAASNELHQVLGVATCLWRVTSRLEPAIRLRWARLVSVFDDPPDLRIPARLEGFEQIEYLVQQEIEQLIRWLFGRVDEANPEAVGLVTDLVRVAILLASSAPIDGVLGGHVPAPTPVSTGGILKIVPAAIDQVKLGMDVKVFRADKLVAEGIVDDLAADSVAMKVMSITTLPDEPQLFVDEGTRVQFSSTETLGAYGISGIMGGF